MKAEEIESLNLNDLDIDELERRLELAPTAATGGGDSCTCNGNCSSDGSWFPEPPIHPGGGCGCN